MQLEINMKQKSLTSRFSVYLVSMGLKACMVSSFDCSVISSLVEGDLDGDSLSFFSVFTREGVKVELQTEKKRIKTNV